MSQGALTVHADSNGAYRFHCGLGYGMLPSPLGKVAERSEVG